MSILVRALTYATLFVALVLVFVPARLLAWSGVARPTNIGAQQMAGMVICALGAVLALWCVLAFALVGKGTPAPFDPPRRLVIRGPYRFIRNPMYVGAGFALGGAALFYGSLPLLAYIGVLVVAVHLFVVSYEEPRLRRGFGQEYAAYCEGVGRWVPKR